MLISILCVAAGLRLWQLGGVPPGLTHDEAGHGQDALAILSGARPIYEAIGYGREPLYDYTVASAMALLGRTDYLVLRWVSALVGTLTVVGVYLWSRRAFGPWEAILASGWLAGSFWGVATSRQALRSTLLPLLLIAAVYFWWRGVFDDDDGHTRFARIWFVAAGLLMGATLWTYMAARVTWMLFVAMPLYILATDSRRFQKHWKGMVLSLVLAGAVAAPMFVWLQRHPGIEQRFSQLGEPLRLIGRGDFKEVWSNSLDALKMFTVHGDDLWVYNLSGRPWLGPIEGLLFYGGLAISVWKWRQPRSALVLMQLLGGIVPSLVTGVSASTTRAIAILPVLYIFPAVALTTIIRWSKIESFILPISLSVLVIAGGQTFRDYFDTWASNRDVRVAYHTTLYEIAHELEQMPISVGTPVVVSTIYPGQFHDPYAMTLLLRRKDLSFRWVDGRGGLVFPNNPSRLILSALAPLDPVLEQIVAPHSRLLISRFLAADDLDPHFDIYEWDSPATVRDILARGGQQTAAWSYVSSFSSEDPQVSYQTLQLPANLGNVIELLRYDISEAEPIAGSNVTLVTYWRILSIPEPGRELVLFTHMLNPNGEPAVVSQQDRLDVPSWNWHPGEVFAQVHHLGIGQDVAPGLYPVEIGAYIRSQPSPVNPNPPTTRLPVLVAEQTVDDRVLLPPLRVRIQEGQ